MTSSLKNWSCPPKIFPFSWKMLIYSNKLLDEKTFKTPFPIKRVKLIFISKRSFPFKRDSGLPQRFFAFFLGKCSFF